MSTPADDLASRISALEEEVARLRHEIALSTADSTSARVLAAGADRDVSDMRAQLRAHSRVLEALRKTQLEQGQDIVALRADMLGGFADVRDEMQTGFADVRDEMQTGFGDVRDKMQTGFATMHVGMTQIVGLLERIGPEQA